MNVEQIYTLVIAATPAITSIIAIVAAVVSAIKKFKKVDGSLESIKAAASATAKENAELKRELQKAYELHSEVVNHIKATKHPENCTCALCSKKEN